MSEDSRPQSDSSIEPPLGDGIPGDDAASHDLRGQDEGNSEDYPTEMEVAADAAQSEEVPGKSFLPPPSYLTQTPGLAPRPRVVEVGRPQAVRPRVVATGRAQGVIRKPVVVPVASNKAGIVTFVLLVATLTGVGWHFLRPVEKRPETVKAAMATPTPVREEPAPVAWKPEPAEQPQTTPERAPMIAQTPAPAPVPTPAPTPPPQTGSARAQDDTDWKTPLVLDPVAARSTAAVARAAKVLRAAAENARWKEYSELLTASLIQELAESLDFSRVQIYDRFISNPYFMRALLQFHYSRRFSPTFERRVASDAPLRGFVVRMLEANETMECLLRAMTPENDMGNVLSTMAVLATDDPDAFGPYRELAAACALVLEQPVTFKFNGYPCTINAGERYRWFKAKDQAGRLAVRISKLNAWELSWVIGVHVSTEEMEWAVTNMRNKYRQSDWGRTYTAVPYDMTYVLTRERKHPYNGYLFSEILKKGGVCGDRAYFGANTARCLGIPAVELAGDGPRGPHAWMAWLAADDQWASSGRFDGYPAGRVTDPRSKRQVSEQVFDRLGGPNAPKGASILKSQQLVWIADVQSAARQTGKAAVTVDYAVSTCPHDGSLWMRKLAALRERQPALTSAEWKTFFDTFRRRFPGDTDLLAAIREAEDQYLLAGMAKEDVKKELAGDIRDLGKFKGLTSLDEIRAAYNRAASVMAKANDIAGIRHIYRHALENYGKESAKFRGIGEDYWKFMQADPEGKLQACRDIQGAFEQRVKTRSGEYFDVKSQNEAATFVAKCWRAAGEESRAARFEKEASKRGETAKKAAAQANR